MSERERERGEVYRDIDRDTEIQRDTVREIGREK